MIKTVRQQCLDAIVDHISHPSHYTWAQDIGIYPGKVTFRRGEVPGITFLVGNETVKRPDYETDLCAVDFEIAACLLIPKDEDGLQVRPFDFGEYVRGELIQAVVTAKLHEYANSLSYQGGSVKYPSEDDQSMVVSVSFRLEDRKSVV